MVSPIKLSSIYPQLSHNVCCCLHPGGRYGRCEQRRRSRAMNMLGGRHSPTQFCHVSTLGMLHSLGDTFAPHHGAVAPRCGHLSTDGCAPRRNRRVAGRAQPLMVIDGLTRSHAALPSRYAVLWILAAAYHYHPTHHRCVASALPVSSLPTHHLFRHGLTPMRQRAASITIASRCISSVTSGSRRYLTYSSSASDVAFLVSILGV